MVAAAVAAALLIWAPWQNDLADPGSGTDPAALTHVHGLGINPADGQLYVATHNGVFQLSADGGPAQLVGTGEQDTMGFTIAGSDQFLASGHPASGQGGPSNLGLMESADGGLTWTTRSLAGEADFHALRFRHGIVYGFNSVTGQLMISSDRVDWQTRAVPPLRDFAVNPDDPDTLLATTQTGLQRSTDGGAAWTPAGAADAAAGLGERRPAVGYRHHE